MKHVLKVLALAMLVALLLPSFAFAGGEGEVADEDQTFSIDVGLGLNDKSAQYASVEYFKELVEERSDGRITVEIYHSSALGDDREMMEDLQVGALEMTCPSTAPMVGFVPDFQVYDLPFLFPTAEAAFYTLDSEVGQDLLDQLADQGIIGLAYWDNGFRHLTNSVREVRLPEDVEGLKLRTMESPLHLAAWRQLGANPTPMAFGELFSAMQQGVVDGQENPFGTIYLQSFFEVQDYVTDTGHIYSPFVFMISKIFWDELPSDLQEIIAEAGVEAGEHNRELNQEWNQDYREELKDVMTVTELTMDERMQWQEAVQPVYGEFEDEIGADLIQAVQDKVAEWQATQ
ncbi:MAG: TRAP transporter substrate-binding protein [Spirochaetaceae bacterium]